MELKLPFKLRIKYLNANEGGFEGKLYFMTLNIQSTFMHRLTKRQSKFPFPVMGVTDDEILVRVSGPSGVYVEDHVKFKGESKWIEIDSDTIFSEIANNQNKFDTMEIFVK